MFFFHAAFFQSVKSTEVTTPYKTTTYTWAKRAGRQSPDVTIQIYCAFSDPDEAAHTVHIGQIYAIHANGRQNGNGKNRKRVKSVTEPSATQPPTATGSTRTFDTNNKTPELNSKALLTQTNLARTLEKKKLTVYHGLVCRIHLETDGLFRFTKIG